MRHQLVALLDQWGHKIKFPRLIQNKICDAFDQSLGLYEDNDVDWDDYAEEDCD